MRAVCSDAGSVTYISVGIDRAACFGCLSVIASGIVTEGVDAVYKDVRAVFQFLQKRKLLTAQYSDHTFFFKEIPDRLSKLRTAFLQKTDLIDADEIFRSVQRM